MNAPKIVRIGRRTVGGGAPCYIIAEIGSNHDGRLDQAKRLIEAAAKSGADAVKFQSIKYDAIWVPGLESAEHRRFFSRLDLPESWYPALKKTADRCGVHFLSCPTYDEAVDLLFDLGVFAYKIASPQTRANLPLVRKAAAKGLPLIVSTGYCGLREIDAAVSACREEGNKTLILLHCVSEYPVAPKKANLRAMAALERRYGVPTGFSDHTLGITAPTAAAALGAAVLEKHFTLDRTLPGPDHAFAAEPREFAEMAKAVRDAQLMLGDGIKRPTPKETKAAKSLQLRLIAAKDLAAGSSLRPESVILRRHGRGLTPEDGPRVFGRRLRRPALAGQPILETTLEVSR